MFRKLFIGFLKMFAGFVVTICVMFGAAYAGIFGEENIVLSKILLEDMQQTFSLQNVVSYATRELDTLNENYGFEKWINKGLDEVKDYGFLKHIKTDDYVLGVFQADFGNLGVVVNNDDYSMNNIEDWIDQVWGKAPEIVNVETEYPGTLGDWVFQTQNDMPGTTNARGLLSSVVNRKSAILGYKQALWNMQFNNKVRLQMEDLLLDSQSSNPGISARIAAQSNTLQNIQLSQLNDSQNSMLRMLAEKKLNKMREDDQTSVNIRDSFAGIINIFKTAPTFGE